MLRNGLTLGICFLICALLYGCGGQPAANSANSQQTDDASYAQQFTDANAALFEGTQLLDRGETDRAIALLHRAVELNPDLGEGWFKLGIAYALVETRDAAIVNEEVTPTPVPGESRPKARKTNSEIAFEKAVEAYKKQVDANPEDHAAFYNLGRAYNKLNDDNDAEKAFRQAVKLNAEDTEYQTDLGAILVKLADYREAIGPLKKAIELDPENSRAIDLLDEAEAGRRRVDYTQPKKGDKGNTNSNANTDANTVAPPENNTAPVASPKPPAPKPSVETNPSPRKTSN